MLILTTTMSTADPRNDSFDDRVTNALTHGTVFELPCGGRIEYQETVKRRESHGATSYVAKFTVERESQGEYKWVFEPTYCTTEFLALCHIEAGDWERV
jgi:hypothetical protein